MWQNSVVAMPGMHNHRYFGAAAVLVLGLTAISTDVQAQNLGNLLRDAAHRAAQQAVQKTIEKATENQKDKQDPTQKTNSKQSQRNKQIEQQMDAMVHPGASKESMEDEAPTVRLPKQHTALFAPLGYPIEEHFGVLSVKPVVPPKKAADQVDWVDNMPYVLDLDNQSLVEELRVYETAEEKGINMNLSPAYHRANSVKDVLWSRCDALNKFVELYNEVLEEYVMDDTPNWVINGTHRRMADILEGDAYKTVIRSSLMPLFVLDGYISDDTKAYFAAHGGYENAHKVKWTAWDPEPDKKQISTSDAGQTGKVLSENSSGAHVDVAGIVYVLHSGKKNYAFASELATTAVAGKDVVIPDYVNYNGRKYPVTSMRGDLFAQTTIRSVKLPATLEEIPNGAFAGTPITEITIPASVEIVQGSVFRDCKNLTRVVFESDNMEAVHGCFQNCVKLQQVVFPKTIRDRMSYDMFAGCTALTSVTLPQNLKVLPERFFDGCKRLTTIELPLSVRQVGAGAFMNSGLVTVSMPGVTDLEDGAFMGCKNLKTVKINSILEEKLKADNFWSYVTNFSECPNLQPKMADGEILLPDGIVVIDKK